MRLIRDGLVNYAGYASASLAGMVLVPMLLRGLRPELYGLWIAATALEYSASCLTGGLGRAVAREVAGAAVEGRKHETRRFVAAAASGYLLFGLLGALLIGLLGFPLSSGLRLSSESRGVAPYVFGLAGVAFFGDQLVAFAAEVLTGKRRFATLNLMTVTGVLVRTVGIVVLLSKGSSLLPVAAWHGLVSLSLGAAAMLLVAWMDPDYLPRAWKVQWTAFRSQMRFGLSTQASAGFTSLLWRSAPFLIGTRLGSAAMVPFEIGQKLPLALFAISWQAAEVVYPAASEYHYAQEGIRTRRLLLVGTRGIVLVTLPICILLWIFAPHLLRIWLGTGHADSVPVLRLTSLAVLADTTAASAVQILYGRGAVNTVLRLTAAAALANIGLTLALLGGLGVTAAAWGLCLTVPAAALVYLKTAARSCAITVTELLRFATRGLVVPSVACAATAGGFARWAPPSNWMTLVIAATSALAAYGAVAGFIFAAGQSRSQLSRRAYSVCRRLRNSLERVPGLRGPVRFAGAPKASVRTMTESPPTSARVYQLCPKRSWMSFKRIAVNASLVLASVLAALIVCEIVLRILSLAPAPRVESWGPRTLVVRDAEFRFLEQTNSIGLRDVREFSKTSRSRRIAFLGDSITYGDGVSNDETFSARTEALLNERSAHSWTILNAGHRGDGTLFEERYLDELLAKVDVDGVVLFYFIDNDPWDNIRENYQLRGRLDEGHRDAVARLMGRNTAIAFKRWLFRNTALYRFVRLRFGTAGTLREFPFTLLNQCDRKLLPTLEQADTLTRDAIQRMKAKLAAHGASLLALVVVPRQEQISEEAFRTFLDAYQADSRNYDRTLPQKHLAATVFNGLGVEVIDLSKDLEGKNPADLYFRVDGHFNDGGHRLVAERMTNWLLEHYGGVDLCGASPLPSTPISR